MRKLHYYCHKVLPLVYDNSLSYYELLSKVVDKLNELIENPSGIKVADPVEWDITRQYTQDTIVIDSDGTAYISKQPVPTGIDINNEEYWQVIFDYADAMDNLREQIAQMTTNNNITFNLDKDELVFWGNELFVASRDLLAGDLLIEDVNVTKTTINDELVKLRTTINDGLAELAEDISDEATAREEADTALETAISEETTARENADTALGDDITAETTAREDADTALGDAITAETTAREDADTALDSRLDTVEETLAETIADNDKRIRAALLPDVITHARSVLRPVFPSSPVEQMQSAGIYDKSGVRYIIVPSHKSDNTNGTVRIYRESNRTLVATLTGTFYHASSIGVIGDKMYICPGNFSGRVIVYNLADIANPVRLSDIDLTAYGTTVFDFNYFDDENAYFTISLYNNSYVRKYNLTTGAVENICKIPSDNYIKGMRQTLAYNPVDKLFAMVTSGFSSMVFFDLEGKVVKSVGISNTLDCVNVDEIEGAFFTPTGELYLSNNPIHWEDADEQSCVWKYEANSFVTPVTDNNYLYVTIDSSASGVNQLYMDGNDLLGDRAATAIKIKYVRDLMAVSKLAAGKEVIINVKNTDLTAYQNYTLPIFDMDATLNLVNNYMIGEIRMSHSELVLFGYNATAANCNSPSHIRRSVNGKKCLIFMYYSTLKNSDVNEEYSGAYVCAVRDASTYVKRASTSDASYYRDGLNNLIINQPS